MDDHIQGAIAQFEGLLTDEREAARMADVDALLRVQDDKRRVLVGLRGSKLGERAVADLSQRARANIALMQQLVDCLRGVAGETRVPATYGATGQPMLNSSRSLRGSL